MTGRAGLRLALVGALLFLAAGSLRAQCSFPGSTHVTWPSVDPVWDFCFRPPSLSSGANGSGLEISDVRYNGTLVIFQAHIPILNVKYVANSAGCGGQNLCYRDWFYSDQAFECAPETSPGVCTGTTTPAKTVCEAPGKDFGDFTGVAVESLADRLKLTAQTQAGWYRYIPIWEFFTDGTIQGRFASTSVDHTCVAYTHHHHAYYRIDVDVNGGAGNYVDRILSGGSTERVATERNFVDTSPARSRWRVGSPGSPYAVEISRNAGDEAAADPFPIESDFPIADGWALAYASNQVSDYSDLTVCPANLNSFDNNQNVNGADLVMWVRAAALHQGEPEGMAADCAMVGPTIKVVPIAPAAARFHTLSPCRIADTRGPVGTYGAPPLSPGIPRTFVLTGQCGIPASARSVSVNLTVVAPPATGYLVAFPSGSPPPETSVLNFRPGRTRANNAVLTLGTGGAVTLRTAVPFGSVHVVMDVAGWFE